MTGFSISMDLAPKKSRSEASSAHASTAEQRLKVFMQDVTGRALVMMKVLPKVNMALLWTWFKKHLLLYTSLTPIEVLKNGILYFILF